VTNSSSGGGATGWGYAPRSGSYSRQEGSNPPMSPPYNGRGTYAMGFSGGNDLFTIYHSANKGSEVYLAYVHRYSDPWQGHSSGVNKNMFQWVNGQATTYMSAQG